MGGVKSVGKKRISKKKVKLVEAPSEEWCLYPDKNGHYHHVHAQIDSNGRVCAIETTTESNGHTRKYLSPSDWLEQL